jgi:hypothetical protein
LIDIHKANLLAALQKQEALLAEANLPSNTASGSLPTGDLSL